MAWEQLLVTHKTFLDPVHGDIHLSALETEVVDASAFQRLARVRQLGFANFVYRGAMHTRFDHSLGTLAVAVRMVAAINANPHAPVRILERACVVIRLAALLHDIGHVPSGHTLEDELGLMQRHDRADVFRALLGPDSEIGAIIRRIVDAAVGPGEGEQLRAVVVAILAAKRDEEIAALEYPYAADIIGNTICADLIDYLARDAHFTGLPERFRERFLDYMFISSDGGMAGDRFKQRVVVRLFKWGTKQLRSDNLSDIISLLRYRFRLSERVYFHHTKMKAGAMIGRALIETDLATDRNIFYQRQLGDDGLIDALDLDGRPVAARRLARSLRSRRLYMNVFEINLDSLPEKNVALAQACLQKLRDKDAYLRWTGDIEQWFHLQPGDVLFYIPPDDMQLKAADVLVAVESDRDIRRLQDIEIDMPAREVRHIQEQHRQLWRFHLFVNPEVDLDTCTAIGRYFHQRCEEEFQFDFENQAPKYKLAQRQDHRDARTCSLDAAIARFLREQRIEMPADERRQLRERALEVAQREPSFGKNRRARQLSLSGPLDQNRVFGDPIPYTSWRDILRVLKRSQ